MKREMARSGFTLIELLVVVAIIALLIAILLPSLGLARLKAKNTACLANLRGINIAYYTYCTEFDGSSVAYRSTTVDGSNNPVRDAWGELLWPSPYPSTLTSTQKYRRSSFNKNRICPLASTPATAADGNGQRYGSADTCWNYLSDEASNTDPTDVIMGSYGFNLNMASDHPPFYSTVTSALVVKLNQDLPNMGVFADCVWRDFKYNTSPVVFPLNLNYWNGPNDTVRAMHDGPVVVSGSVASIPGGSANGVERNCIDRHQHAINVGFRDGSASRVVLHDLWNIKWNMDGVPVNVVGAPPNHLPAPY